jgi:type IV secretory pathway protease TraF
MKRSLVIFTIAAICALASYRYAIGFNQTLSLNGSIYLIDKSALSIKNGDLVLFRFDKDPTRFPNGIQFLKIASCLAGDRLLSSQNGAVCVGKNGVEHFNAPQTIDIYGAKLTHFEFDGVVPRGKLFVTTPHPRSYDSRYWGFVDEAEIIGTAKELL